MAHHGLFVSPPRVYSHGAQALRLMCLRVCVPRPESTLLRACVFVSPPRVSARGMRGMRSSFYVFCVVFVAIHGVVITQYYALVCGLGQGPGKVGHGCLAVPPTTAPGLTVQVDVSWCIRVIQHAHCRWCDTSGVRICALPILLSYRVWASPTTQGPFPQVCRAIHYICI